MRVIGAFTLGGGAVYEVEANAQGQATRWWSKVRSI
jgi:hypothetical protein